MTHSNVFEAFYIGDYDGFEPRPATGPTQAQPGTTEKLRVIAARVFRGEECFHPEDGPEDSE